MRIGLFGAEISSINKGVSALAISQIAIINQVCQQNNIAYKITIFSDEKEKYVDSMCSELSIDRDKIDFYPVSYRNFTCLKNLFAEIKKIDCLVDITGGDSFSDIYGMKLFIRSCIHKYMILKQKKKFMLGPQTYGPFKKNISKKIGYNLIKNADYVISRDRLSYEMMPSSIQEKMIIGTDVAFALPYSKNKTLNNQKINLGINISQLLLTKQFFGKDGIELSVDYSDYINRILEYFSKLDEYQIHLIPHVIDDVTNEITFNENDCIANEKLVGMYPKIEVAPFFNSPIEAKSYISNMDVFIGSRMHATIAAFSSGVATIPVAYSRKFKGVFSNVGYDYIIDATVENTERAFERTKEYVENYSLLRDSVTQCNSCIEKPLNIVKKTYESFLLEAKNN